MPIEGFDYKEFAKSLSEQVGPALPPDIPDADKQYIVNIVFNFCYMAGEAIANDTSLNFNAQQASIVSQFIGEWAFHKSIDIIRSGIDPQFRDAILQKIAFTIFEIAKTAIIKNLPQADMIAVVEHHVKKAYAEALDELKKRGVLNEEQVKEALSHSNIDEMAKAQAQQQIEEQQTAQSQPVQEQSQSSAYIQQTNDTKILKLATFAIVLRQLPPEKRQGVLSRFSPEDAAILSDYASMDDLESKLDKGLVVKCLKEIKKTLPPPRKLSTSKMYDRLYKIVKNSDISKISNMIMKERQVVKSFVSSAAGQGKAVEIPARVADIICTHIEDKLAK